MARELAPVGGHIEEGVTVGLPGNLAVLSEISVVANLYFPTTLKNCYPNPTVWLTLFTVYEYSSSERQLS